MTESLVGPQAQPFLYVSKANIKIARAWLSKTCLQKLNITAKKNSHVYHNDGIVLLVTVTECWMHSSHIGMFMLTVTILKKLMCLYCFRKYTYNRHLLGRRL